MRQISADEEEKVGRIRELMRGYADGVEANRKLLEAAATSVDGPDIAFVQVGALISLIITLKTTLQVQEPLKNLQPLHSWLSALLRPLWL